VTELEHGGNLREAATLLESKQRHRAAAARWQRAGDAPAAARCEALELERLGRLDAAAAAWASLGDLKAEARCRALVHLGRGEYDQAALAYERAGNREASVGAGLTAAKLRGDYAAAERLLREAGMGQLQSSVLGTRDQWLVEARAFAAHHARRQRWGRRTDNMMPQFRLPVKSSAPHPLPAENRAPHAPPHAATGPRGLSERPHHHRDGNGTTSASAVVLDTLRQHPGLTCEEIADMTRMTTGALKPLLAAMTARGDLLKTGRTRGTRYSPA
jgi:hypothetical protein